MPRAETTAECVWPSNPRASLREKPSCYQHGATASRDATWNCITQGESHTSILCRNATKFSGPEIMSDRSKEISLWFSLFLGKKGHQFCVPKMIRLLSGKRCKRIHYGVRCDSVHSMGRLCKCKGIIDREAYIGILETHAAINATSFPRKPVAIIQVQASFCTCHRCDFEV